MSDAPPRRTERMSEAPAPPRLPFIILSATIDDATARRAIEGGASACLTKYDLSRLAPAVLELVGAA
jgi:hypothetical protein